MTDDLLDRTLTEVADLVAEGEVSSVELVEGSLRRIEQIFDMHA